MRSAKSIKNKPVLLTDNMGFSHCKLIKLMGQGFEDILDHDTGLVIEDSGKDTKKTFNCLMRYIFFMCNIQGLNCLITRNTVALLQKTIIKSFWKCIKFLIDNGITELANIRDATKSNIEKLAVWPDDRVINFLSFDNIIAGVDARSGFYGYWLIEEPMQREMPLDYNYQEQNDKFKELSDTLFRGVPSGWITWPCCKKKYWFDNKVNMLFNDWDEKQWINKDIVNFVFPWSSEYENWILENPLKNFKQVKVNKDMVITPKIKGVTVIRTTKFINEFRNIKADNINLEALKNNDPFLKTAIIGAPFRGTDETVFIWRQEILTAQDYNLDDFKNDCLKIRVYGWDGGKADNNVLTVLSFKEIDGQIRACVTDVKNYQIIKNAKNNLKKLDIIRLCYEWIKKDISDNHIDSSWEIAFSYDDHEETTANLLAEWLADYNIEFIPAQKNGWYKIENRIKIIKVLISDNRIIVPWNDKLYSMLLSEFWSQQWISKNGELIRDGIHFKNDFQNSLEYSIYCSLNLLNEKTTI